MEIIVPPGLAGDFNEDDKVDAADYVKWRKDGHNPLPNDEGAANAAARFALWKANFGEMTMPGGGSGGVRAVPEPGLPGVAALIALAAGAGAPPLSGQIDRVAEFARIQTQKER